MTIQVSQGNDRNAIDEIVKAINDGGGGSIESFLTVTMGEGGDYQDAQALESYFSNKVVGTLVVTLSSDVDRLPYPTLLNNVGALWIVGNSKNVRYFYVYDGLRFEASSNINFSQKTVLINSVFGTNAKITGSVLELYEPHIFKAEIAATNSLAIINAKMQIDNMAILTLSGSPTGGVTLSGGYYHGVYCDIGGSNDITLKGGVNINNLQANSFGKIKIGYGGAAVVTTSAFLQSTKTQIIETLGGDFSGNSVIKTGSGSFDYFFKITKGSVIVSGVTGTPSVGNCNQSIASVTGSGIYFGV